MTPNLKNFAFTPKSSHLLLFLCILIVFFSMHPSLDNGFIQLDDPNYVTNNPDIQSLKLNSAKKMFTSFVIGNYHPLTSLSLALDYQWTQLNPRGYHITNITLHLVNTALVYILIAGMTKSNVAAILVALLFGIHPTRVESVAWITERKDVLFCFFYLCGLNLYVNRIQKPLHYHRKTFFIFFLFLCSLLSKPAAVSFPLVLFLLDYYFGIKQKKHMTLEKIALISLSLLFGSIAIYGNWHTPLEQNTYLTNISFHWPDRIILSTYAFALYISKCILPMQLSAFYPYPEKVFGTWPPSVYWQATSFMALCAIIFVYFRKNREVIFGFLFFIVTICFNLPIFGVGHTIIADRFTYIPYIGLFLIMLQILKNFSTNLLKREERYKYFLVTILILTTMLLSASTRKENSKWESNFHFWTDIIKKNPNIPSAYHNLAVEFLRKSQIDTALVYINKAIALNENNADSYNLRGVIHIKNEDSDEAFKDFDKAVKLRPDLISALNNRASSYRLQNNCVNAIKDYEEILRNDPTHSEARKNIQICREPRAGEG